jgi:hypothetical protein
LLLRSFASPTGGSDTEMAVACAAALVSRASCRAGEEARSQVRRAPRNARRGREHDVAGQFRFCLFFFVILTEFCLKELWTAGSHVRRQCSLLSVNEYSSIRRMFDF